jgi:hypothetical protein
LSPETVSDAYPLYGAFSRTSETVAASKLKIGLPVPEIEERVNVAAAKTSANALDRHASVVADVQDAVKQTAVLPAPPGSRPTVAVWSLMPKSRPDIDKDAWPLCGAFIRACDTTAASKLKTPMLEPTTFPTVTSTRREANESTDDSAAPRHFKEVAEVHAEVNALTKLKTPVAVCSAAPKSSPETVKDAYPLRGVFNETPDDTAASKLNMGRPVPETAATVALAILNKSPNAFDRHPSVVADVQDDVKHTPRSPPPPSSSPAVAVCSPTPKSSPDTVSDAYPV